MDLSNPARLLSDEKQHYQDYLNALIADMASTAAVDGIAVPELGAQGLMLGTGVIPMFVYDNQDLTAMIGTAFTDFTNCFYSVQFMDEIFKGVSHIEPEATRNQAAARSMQFLIQHELSHIMLNHADRLKDFSPQIANQATDMVINTRLRRDYSDRYTTLSKALSVGVGMTEEESQRFGNESEESIARTLTDEMIDNQKNRPQQGPGGTPQQGQQGNGSPQQGQSGQQQGQQGNASQDPNGAQQHGQGSGSGQPDPNAKPGSNGQANGGTGTLDVHGIDAAKRDEIFRKVGLDGLADALGGSDPAAQKAAQEAIEHAVKDAINKIDELRQTLGDRVPGGHFDGYVSKRIKDLHKPKFTWINVLNNLMLGSGGKSEYTDSVPLPEYFADIGVSWEGIYVPAEPDIVNLVIIDTSGSVSEEEMCESFSETYGMVSTAGPGAPEVLYMCADTALRGEPVLLTSQNYQQTLKDIRASGGGGTDIAAMIADGVNSIALQDQLTQGKKLGSVIVFTDLGDAPTTEERLRSRGLDIHEYPQTTFNFMTFPGTYNEQWAAEVSSYASVHSMGERKVVDLNAAPERPVKRPKP